MLIIMIIFCEDSEPELEILVLYSACVGQFTQKWDKSDRERGREQRRVSETKEGSRNMERAAVNVHKAVLKHTVGPEGSEVHTRLLIWDSTSHLMFF